jgi:hypothetical protein
MGTKARVEPPQTLAAQQGIGPTGRPLCPLGLGSVPFGPCVKYTLSYPVFTPKLSTHHMHDP